MVGEYGPRAQYFFPMFKSYSFVKHTITFILVIRNMSTANVFFLPVRNYTEQKWKRYTCIIAKK